PPQGATCSAELASVAAFMASLPPRSKDVRDAGPDAAIQPSPPLSATPRPWVSVDAGRWQGALDGYQPSATPSRVLPLGTAPVPFARYFNSMHARIHVLFGDWFLESL